MRRSIADPFSPAGKAGTRLEWDDATCRLRAIAVVDRHDEHDEAAQERVRHLARHLNVATESAVRHLRGGGHFATDLARRELLLVLEFDLRNTTFDDLLLSIRRLGRVADRWHSMRPAHARKHDNI